MHIWLTWVKLALYQLSSSQINFQRYRNNFRHLNITNIHSIRERMVFRWVISYSRGTSGYWYPLIAGCPWATSVIWEFKSRNTYEYIIMLIKRIKKTVIYWEFNGSLFEQTWIPFTQGCIVPSLVDIGHVVLEKIFNFSQCIFAIS